MSGIDPQTDLRYVFTHLRYVFTHIADYPINRAANLLRWNVADRLPQKSV